VTSHVQWQPASGKATTHKAVGMSPNLNWPVFHSPFLLVRFVPAEHSSKLPNYAQGPSLLVLVWRVDTRISHLSRCKISSATTGIATCHPQVAGIGASPTRSFEHRWFLEQAKHMQSHAFSILYSASCPWPWEGAVAGTYRLVLGEVAVAWLGTVGRGVRCFSVMK
jgi:hypothetical protein